MADRADRPAPDVLDDSPSGKTPATARCPDCGAELSSAASSGVSCPRCLIGIGLDSVETDPPENRSQSRADDFPDQIGPFRILEPLGEGGMGVVYLAEQVTPVRRRVALKILKPGMDTRAVLARFEAERRALALMEHANIARVLDAGETDRGRPYFVMELVKGESITTYCDRHGLSTRERLDLFVPVCLAIQHAHHKGIIHRDLKPSNILVTLADGRPVPKVIDFGIAKATNLSLTEQTLYTRHGEMIGTPEYMSPEQAEMTGLDVDTRTDVYSLGVVLYEMLTGVPPFDPDTLRAAGYAEVQRILREDDPPRPSTRVRRLLEGSSAGKPRRSGGGSRMLVRQLRGELDWIVLKAMSKDRTRRYGTPDSFAQDVRRFLDHKPVLAGPPSTIYHLRKFARRNRMALALAAAILAGVAAVTTSTAIQAKLIAAERDRANHEAEVATEVADFLQNLFRISDPSEARGNAVTAREILDRGSQRIQEDLEGQPRVQARLMAVMGQVYRHMGLAKDADPLAAAAAEAARHDPDGDPQVLARYLINLAWIRRDLGDYEGAVEITRDAVTVAEGTNDPKLLAYALNDHGSMLRSFRDFDGARNALERALEYREQMFGPDHLRVGGTLYQLGWMYHQLDEPDRALGAYERACRILRRELGPDHADVAWCYSDRAMVLAVSGRFEESIRDNERAREIRERILPPDHPELAISVYNLGHLHAQMGDLARGVEFMEEALAMRLRSLGPDHNDVAAAHDYLGWIHDKLGNTGEAERHYRTHLEITARSPSAGQPTHARVLHEVALFYGRHARWAEAETHLQRALEIYDDTVGASDPYLAKTLYTLAQCQARDRDRLGESSETLKRYLEIHRQAEEPDRKRIALGQYQLGRVEVMLGRTDQAIRSLEAAVPVLEESYGGDDRRVGNGLWWLATAYGERVSVQEADHTYRRAFEIYENSSEIAPEELAVKRAAYHAARDEREPALRHLRAAIEQGGSVSDLWRYPQLAAFQDDPEFRELTGSF